MRKLTILALVVALSGVSFAGEMEDIKSGLKLGPINKRMINSINIDSPKIKSSGAVENTAVRHLESYESGGAFLSNEIAKEKMETVAKIMECFGRYVITAQIHLYEDGKYGYYIAYFTENDSPKTRLLKSYESGNVFSSDAIAKEKMETAVKAMEYLGGRHVIGAQINANKDGNYGYYICYFNKNENEKRHIGRYKSGSAFSSNAIAKEKMETAVKDMECLGKRHIVSARVHLSIDGKYGYHITYLKKN